MGSYGTQIAEEVEFRADPRRGLISLGLQRRAQLLQKHPPVLRAQTGQLLHYRGGSEELNNRFSCLSNLCVCILTPAKHLSISECVQVLLSSGTAVETFLFVLLHYLSVLGHTKSSGHIALERSSESEKNIDIFVTRMHKSCGLPTSVLKNNSESKAEDP